MPISKVFTKVKLVGANAACGLYFGLLAWGCTPEKVRVHHSESTWYQLEEQHNKGDFVLQDVRVNPAARRQVTGGISLNFSFGLSAFNRLLLRDETDFGYDSYRITAQLFRPDGQPLSQAKAITEAQVFPAPVRQESVFRVGAYAPPEFFFPFRDLALAEGSQQVLIEVKGYAQLPGKKAAAEPALTLRLATGFVQPRLVSVKIGVDYFELDTEKVDPHSFDFRMAGSGFPDLCWRLLSGTRVIYTSAVAKNKIRFSSEESSPGFVVAETDSVRLELFDDDELSDHDMLATWLGNPASLPRQTGQKVVFPPLSNGQIRKAKVWAEITPLEINRE